MTKQGWSEFFTIEVKQEPRYWIARISVNGSEPKYLCGSEYHRYLDSEDYASDKFSSKRSATRAAKKYCRQQYRAARIQERSDWMKV